MMLELTQEANMITSDFSFVTMNSKGQYVELVNCFECDAEFETTRYESVCPDCQELININRAHA